MSTNPCPSYLAIPEEVRNKLFYFPDESPKCCGTWLSGSGAYRIHLASCDKDATWWHPDDIHSYCDEHCPEDDKELYGKWWQWRDYGLTVKSND